MDWELWPILDLQIHFSPTQLLWDSEITLFAGSNARVVQAFSRVEGVWLLSCAPGSTQNISEATLPSKSLCRQEVHLPSLSKMQFVWVRATCPRRGQRPRGVSVTALAAAGARPRAALGRQSRQRCASTAGKDPAAGFSCCCGIRFCRVGSLSHCHLMLCYTCQNPELVVCKAWVVFSLQTKLYYPKLFLGLLAY